MTDFQPSTSDPTLGDLLRYLWAAKAPCILFGAIGFVLAIVWMTLAVPQYRASVLIAPAERSRGADIQSLLPQSSSIAIQSLVNSIAPQDQADFVRFTHVLRRPVVSGALLKSGHDLEAVRIHKRFGYQGKNDALDSPERLARYLGKRVSIDPVGNTQLRRVSYDHPDPKFAVFFLTQLYGIADDMMRTQSRKDTDERIAYLKRTLRDTLNADHRRALTSLLMEQEHMKMILAMDAPYAAEMVELPSASVKPHWPNGVLVYGVFIFAGFFLGFALHSVRNVSD